MRPAAIAACALLAGCAFVHRIDIQQGNYLTQETAAKVKVGMTRNEVRQALGTPLLTDVFHANRWDYYFSNAKSGRTGETKRFTVLFKDDKVVSFGGTTQPNGPPQGAEPLGTPPPK